MKIGLVGYRGSGKSSLFEWLTAQVADPSLAHVGQTAMAAIPDDRIEPLCGVYQPKKVTQASIELVDTPGLERSHEGNASRLAVLREAGCLVLVVAGFSGSDPEKDLASFEEDLLLADMELLSGRVERLRESVKKPRPSRDQELAELAALEPLLAALESGTAIRDVELGEEQRRAIRSFRLLTEKPKMILVNVADDQPPSVEPDERSDGQIAISVPVGMELELERMDESERSEFEDELGWPAKRRDLVLRTMMDVSGHFLYFTAGDKEVRSWLLPKGGTALAAADNVHSDLARGFIRAETMTCDDLFRLGSEREVKAQNLMRKETKEYVVQDGDILHILSNV